MAGQKLNKGHANTASFFQCLTNIGFQPKHVIDVGAHKGAWTRTALEYFPDAYYSLFEPQKDLLQTQYDLVKNCRIGFYYYGVGSKSEVCKMTMSPRRDSFTFQWNERQAVRLGRAQFEVEVITLDEFLPKILSNLPSPDILKIDAEGWDLEVLKGAEKTAASAKIILLEAGVMNKNFANDAREVINAMFDRGFVLFDITDLNRTSRDSGLWNVELAFVRRGGELDCAIDRYV